jgi:lipopolysaccharide transport system permease protein
MVEVSSNRERGAVREFSFASSLNLFYLLTRSDIAGKYKTTVFGQLWSLANPLANIAIYSVVFGLVFRVVPPVGEESGLTNFALFLVVGLLPWLFFSGVLIQSAQSIVSNAGLIQKVYFPRIVLPLSTSTAALSNWGLEMAVLVVVLLFFGTWMLPFLPLVILTMLVLWFFATGLGLIVSVINVYFRDFSYLLTIVLQFGFFLAPILYPLYFIEDISAETGPLWGTPITVIDIYSLNPMVAFVEIFRAFLYDGVFPSSRAVIEVLIWTVVAVTAGLLVFKRTEKRLAEIL